MRRTTWLARTTIALSCLSLLLLISGHAPADDSSAAASKAAGTAKKTERKEPRGRLPAYYTEVVSPKQREQIYIVQARYQVEIERLKAELRKVVEERNEKVRAVLTTEQQAEVDKIAAERRAARKEAALRAKQQASGGTK